MGTLKLRVGGRRIKMVVSFGGLRTRAKCNLMREVEAKLNDVRFDLRISRRLREFDKFIRMIKLHGVLRSGDRSVCHCDAMPWVGCERNKAQRTAARRAKVRMAGVNPAEHPFEVQ